MSTTGPAVATQPVAANESGRPFLTLGEVAAPGQYRHLSNMSVESAMASAGGSRIVVPLGFALSSGDTALVGKRWL